MHSYVMCSLPGGTGGDMTAARLGSDGGADCTVHVQPGTNQARRSRSADKYLRRANGDGRLGAEDGESSPDGSRVDGDLDDEGADSCIVRDLKMLPAWCDD